MMIIQKEAKASGLSWRNSRSLLLWVDSTKNKEDCWGQNIRRGWMKIVYRGRGKAKEIGVLEEAL